MNEKMKCACCGAEHANVTDTVFDCALFQEIYNKKYIIKNDPTTTIT